MQVFAGEMLAPDPLAVHLQPLAEDLRKTCGHTSTNPKYINQDI